MTLDEHSRVRPPKKASNGECWTTKCFRWSRAGLQTPPKVACASRLFVVNVSPSGTPPHARGICGGGDQSVGLAPILPMEWVCERTGPRRKPSCDVPFAHFPPAPSFFPIPQHPPLEFAVRTNEGTRPSPPVLLRRTPTARILLHRCSQSHHRTLILSSSNGGNPEGEASTSSTARNPAASWPFLSHQRPPQDLLNASSTECRSSLGTLAFDGRRHKG
jgi:hypothetical protein